MPAEGVAARTCARGARRMGVKGLVAARACEGARPGSDVERGVVLCKENRPVREPPCVRERAQSIHAPVDCQQLLLADSGTA